MRVALLPGCLLVLIACSSSPSTEPSSAPPDAGGPTSADASVSDGRADAAGTVVTEKPAPDCNDLPQLGAVVTPVANPGAAPSATPLTTLDPGVYVAKESTEYGTSATTAPAVQVTIAVTTTRYYYRFDSSTAHQIATFAWSLANGTLTRDPLCSSVATTSTAQNRVEVAPNGFVLYAQSGASVVAIRYERVA